MPCPALFLTFEACHDAALIIDAEGEVIHLNSSAQKLFEWGQGANDSVRRRKVNSFFTVGHPLTIDSNETSRLTRSSEARGALGKRGGAEIKSLERMGGQTAASSSEGGVWTTVTKELATTRHESRSAIGFRADGSSFPATVNLLKLDDTYCLGGTMCESTLSDHDSTYICAFVRDLEEHNKVSTMEKRVKELERENARLQRTNDAIVEASGDSIIVIDEDGIIQYLDKSAQSKFEYSEGELVGKNVSALMGEDHASNHNGYIQRYLATGEKHVIGRRRELTAMKKDGRSFPMELSVAQIETDPSEKRLFVGMISDSTVKELAYSMLERSERIRMGMLDSTSEAMFSISSSGIILTANKAATNIFGWMAEEMVGHNIDMIIKKNPHEPIWGGQKYAVHCKGLHFRGMDSVGSASNGTSLGSSSHGLDIHPSTMTGSLFGDFLSSFLTLTEGSDPGPIKQEMIGRRMGVADFPVELTLAKIGEGSKQEPEDERIFCAFVRDLTRQKEAEQELRAKSKVMAGIFEAAFDALFVIDEKGIIEVVNNAALSQFGWTREELVGNNISMICGGGHAKNHDKYIARFLMTGEKKVMGKKRELVARRKNGETFYIELGLAEVRTEEGDEPGRKPKRRFCGFVRDLTAHRTTQIELKREKNMTSGIIKAAFDPLFVINESGTINLVNDAAVEQFGWTRWEMLGRNIRMICGGGRAPHHDSYIKRYLKTGEKRAMGKKRELLALRKDGSEFPIELGLTEVQTEDGEERQFCGFIRDLTRQKANEVELMRKEDISPAIVEASFDSVLLIDDGGIIQMVNSAAIKQFGWSKDEMLGKNVSLIVGGSHSENHDRYMKRYIETGEKRVMGKRRELEAKKKDGTLFPIDLGLTEVQVADKSRGRMFCGFIKDLTSQKAAKAEIKRKQELTSSIIEASLDAMLSIDNQGEIRMVNEATVRLFGWSRSEFLGQDVCMIVGGSNGKHHEEYIRQYLQPCTGERRVMKREINCRRKDGVEFPVELGLSEIVSEDNNNKPQRQFCGFIKDLTEQKKLETQLKAAQLKATQNGDEASSDRICLKMFASPSSGDSSATKPWHLPWS